MTFVTPAEFKSRRQKLLDFVGNNIAIIHGAKELFRNGDVHFPFRQNSNFYYLTGFNEPDAIAVFTDSETILFNRPRNPEREVWEGKREGQEGVIKNYGLDKAYPIEKYEEKIKLISKNKTLIDTDNFLSELRY
jgi:Xaa-Pro aminopeptidase